uniref:Uncharacterized protein n=1 Tax=Anguilla anguilla TaxID=7936 RepID=A0A0E9SW58_ANGAN
MAENLTLLAPKKCRPYSMPEALQCSGLPKT